MRESKLQPYTTEAPLDTERKHTAPIGEPNNSIVENQPNLSQGIERESAKLEKNLEDFRALINELSPEQANYIVTQMEEVPENKKLFARLQEATHALIHSYDHSKEHLSDHYDPRLVKVVGGVGKVLGGFAGFISGHGVMSAPGSVVGSKAGGYAMLKLFKELTEYLPDELHDKIRHPDKLENKLTTISENQAKLEASLSTKENLMTEFGELCDEFSHLSEEEKSKLPEILANRESAIVSAAEQVRATYTKYHDAFKRFEKKHPIVATGTEVVVHMAIAPILEGFHLGEAAVHAIEVLASTGGAEKITTHLFNVAHHIRDSITSGLSALERYTVPPLPQDSKSASA